MHTNWNRGARLLVGALVVLPAYFCAGTSKSRPQDPVPLATTQDKVNYGIGVQVGRNFKRQGMDIDVDLVARGMRDALAGRKLQVPEPELQEIMRTFEQERRRKQARDLKIAAIDNQRAGAEFLAANGKRDGVITLPSGLQYEVLEAGTGPKPTVQDTIRCNYRGTLIDGTEFDASEPGVPAVFSIKGSALIAGLSEALQLMPTGSKWKVFVPGRLAYSSRGNGPLIGPNATLIFEVELLAVEPAHKDGGK